MSGAVLLLEKVFVILMSVSSFCSSFNGVVFTIVLDSSESFTYGSTKLPRHLRVEVRIL
jgi:hypothetical protein